MFSVDQSPPRGGSELYSLPAVSLVGVQQTLLIGSFPVLLGSTYFPDGNKNSVETEPHSRAAPRGFALSRTACCGLTRTGRKEDQPAVNGRM